MTKALAPAPLDEIDEDDAALMIRYGIKMVPTPRYHYKSFRFSRLADALRQAQADERVSG